MHENSNNNEKKNLDGISIWLSSICLIHCLTLPLITISIPFFGKYMEGHFHSLMLFIVIPISIIALTKGYQNHKNIIIVIVGLFGGITVIIGATYVHYMSNYSSDTLVTISGSVLLALAHFFNNRSSHYHPESCKQT